MASSTQHVDTLGHRGPWALDPTSAAPIDGMTVLAAPGGGRYLRIATGKPGAAAQAAWYINAATGDDDNDGASPATALRTLGEWSLRLADQEITIAMTVSWAGDDAAAYLLSPNVIPGAGSLTLVGTRTTANEPGRTYTLSAVTNWDGATQTTGTCRLQDDLGGHPDLAALGWDAGRAFMSNDVFPAILSPIGAQQALVGECTCVWGDERAASSLDPSPGDPVTVYVCNRVGWLRVVNRNADAVLIVRDLFLVAVTVAGPGNTRIEGCLTSANGTLVSSGTGEVDIFSSALGVFGSDAVLQGRTVWSSVYSANNTYVLNGGILSVRGTAINDGSGVILGLTQASLDPAGSGTLTIDGVFQGLLSIINYPGSATGEGLTIANGQVLATSYLWLSADGAAPLVGIHVHRGGLVRYGAGLLPVVAAVDPAAPWIVGATTYTQAALAAAVPLDDFGAIVTEDA